MKTKTNLEEPTLNDSVMVNNLKNTMRVISGVIKLTKKIFML